MDFTAGRCACVVSMRPCVHASLKQIQPYFSCLGPHIGFPNASQGSCNKRYIKTERSAEHRDYLYRYLKLFSLPLCFQGTTACDTHACARGHLHGRLGSHPMLVGCGGVILRVAPPITNYAETRAPVKRI